MQTYVANNYIFIFKLIGNNGISDLNPCPQYYLPNVNLNHLPYLKQLTLWKCSAKIFLCLMEFRIQFLQIRINIFILGQDTSKKLLQFDIKSCEKKQLFAKEQVAGKFYFRIKLRYQRAKEKNKSQLELQLYIDKNFLDIYQSSYRKKIHCR